MSDPRDALEAIGQLPDAEIDLADAAIQLSRVDLPDADWRAAQAHISQLARDAVMLDAATLEDGPAGRAGALAGLISGRYGYAGDTETYDDVANMNLIQVIDRRRGLPVALGILWLHCAQAAGWGAHGIDFPGHFLVALTNAGLEGPPKSGQAQAVVLDVFNGGSPLDVRELRALLKRAEGPKAELRPALMQPMASRAILLRLQNNLKARRLRGNDFPGALAALDDMLRIAPAEAMLWREAAFLNQRLDHVAAALRCFERFLALVPPGDAAIRARAAMDELRTRLN